MERRESESVGLKPFRASKEWAISSASTNPAPLVSSPRQRSAGRELGRGELANRHRDQRTISHPQRSVPPLPDPPHQSGLMEREKKTVVLRRFLKFETPRKTCSKTEMRPILAPWQLAAEPLCTQAGCGALGIRHSHAPKQPGDPDFLDLPAVGAQASPSVARKRWRSSSSRKIGYPWFPRAIT